MCAHTGGQRAGREETKEEREGNRGRETQHRGGKTERWWGEMSGKAEMQKERWKTLSLGSERGDGGRNGREKRGGGAGGEISHKERERRVERGMKEKERKKESVEARF